MNGPGCWSGRGGLERHHTLRHALVLLGALGPVTSRIELGSYVVPTFPRHPAVLAQQALTVQQSSSKPARARHRPEP